jgi:hypothetical protein
MPSAIVDKIVKAFDAEQIGNSYYVPCGTILDLRLKIGGIRYTIPLEQMSRESSFDDKRCQLLISKRESDVWILGGKVVYCYY